MSQGNSSAFILLALALILLWISRFIRKRTGLPNIQVAYQDTLQGVPLKKPLFDRKLRLTGRPDYLVKDKGEVIPMEVKMRRAPNHPFDSHVMQLAAYCRLVESEYGRRPSYGIIKYSDRNFNVPYTKELEDELLNLMKDMRRKGSHRYGRLDDVHRSHSHTGRCQNCGYGEICEEKI